MSLLMPAAMRHRQSHSTAARPAKVHRRLTVRVEPDGLLVYGSGANAARIPWGKPERVQRLEDWPAAQADEIECPIEGILGLLQLFQRSYLLTVGSSTSAAVLPTSERSQLRTLTDVFAVPLERVMATKVVRQRAAKFSDEDSSGSASDADEAPLRDFLLAAPLGGWPTERRGSDSRDKHLGFGASFFRPSPSRQRDLSALANHVEAKDQTPRTVTAKPDGFTAPSDPTLSQIAQSATIQLPSIHASAHTRVPSPDLVSRAEQDKAAREQLDIKVLRECIREMRHCMCFSYDAAITRSLQWKARRRKEAAAHNLLAEADTEISLLDREDPRFLWNRYLSRPFVKADLHNFVVPLMQGFAQQETVTIITNNTSVEITMTIVSRRSIERAGLRYMRRGINTAGQAANFVETEFVVELRRRDMEEPVVSSFVQTRGSIPLFWSQTPWSLKPVPVLERSPAENTGAAYPYAGFSKHFETQSRLYGTQVVINLAEQHGKEGIVVQAYRKAADELDKENVKYLEFDFHAECKGMHFENVSRLVKRVESNMAELSFCCLTPHTLVSSQNGVFRTNCMDCLDRTNVVQSALARRQMVDFLGSQGATATDQLNKCFNELWACNGDAISRAYAGTSALKGDFVRSGKRNWRGVLNDATNSLSRMWQNTVADFFRQSLIDYVLGINLSAFEEYQDKVVSSDPGELLRVATIRGAAIETASAHVLLQDEKLSAGWTLLSPTQVGRRTGPAFEEKVLLLSDKAVYACSYEYHLQKVREYARIPLLNILSIIHGPYILSTLSPFARDREENAGFVLTFEPGAAEGRAAAYAVHNKMTRVGHHPASDEDTSTASEELLPTPPEISEMAFKVMRRDIVQFGDDTHSAAQDSTPNADATTRLIVGALHRACQTAGVAGAGNADAFVREEAVVSFEEADRNTSLLARLKHNIEHFIWL